MVNNTALYTLNFSKRVVFLKCFLGSMILFPSRLYSDAFNRSLKLSFSDFISIVSSDLSATVNTYTHAYICMFLIKIPHNYFSIHAFVHF